MPGDLIFQHKYPVLSNTDFYGTDKNQTKLVASASKCRISKTGLNHII